MSSPSGSSAPASWKPPTSPVPFTEADRELLGELPNRVARLREQIGQRIIGQERTVEQLVTAFLAGGHVLVIGVPGLAKTLMIRTLADLFDARFARIQFTPDLMPSDITGTSILVKDEATGARHFQFREGPIFTNLLLADEINRTPPKTQAALLEAMEEFQSTVGGHAYPMPRPFFVLATQNPIEQEGTYPLPVTQLDRFLFQIDVDYPDAETEFEVIASTTATMPTELSPILTGDEVLRLLQIPKKVIIPTGIIDRAVRLVRATRPTHPHAGAPPGVDSLPGTPVSSRAAEEWVSWGAGPRAVQSILSAARATAVLDGRDTVNDADYEKVVYPAVRHRVLLNYHAEAEKIRPDAVLRMIREDIGDKAADVPEDEKRTLGRFGRILRAIGDPSPGLKRRRASK